MCKSDIIIMIAVLAVSITNAQQSPQTPQEIAQQKSLADQSMIEGAPEQFKSPLKTFETYFAGICRLDASEYLCLTRQALKEWFGKDELSAEALQSIRNGHQTRDEKDHVLLEFRYTHDAQRPRITFGYRYSFKFSDGEFMTTIERERLTLVRTAEGWKIDLVEDVSTP